MAIDLLSTPPSKPTEQQYLYPGSAQVSRTSLLGNGSQTEPMEDVQDKMFDYSQAIIQLRRLVTDWNAEVEQSDIRRRTRKAEVDVEALRQDEKLDDDEIIVPQRIIDSNIARDIPPYINYLKNSRRTGIFKDVKEPGRDTERLETEFTAKTTYSAWEIPFYKCVDGAELHGWDWIEVIYDETKPGKYAIEQIGHDKFFFPRSTIDIQYCPRCIRAHDVTVLQLQEYVTKFGFNQEQVQIILSKYTNTSQEEQTQRIYKTFLKKNNVVYCAWFCLQEGCSDWLKAPVQHDVGIVDDNGMPAPLQFYPVFVLPYRMTEEATIVAARGRGFIDEPKQEAYTAIWSSFINGMTRASNLYASLGSEDGTGQALKELQNLKLVGGRIFNRKIEFFSPPYPDEGVLRMLQYADVQNSAEIGQPNFAAMNREDSRKTAKEIGSAEKQQGMLNSVQLTLFSVFLRQVWSFVWLIIQSQAKAGNINFLVIQQEQPQINPLTKQPIVDPKSGQVVTQTIEVNDVATISRLYDVRAAGDTDVVQKEETVQKMQQDLPLVQNTPLYDLFLVDYFKLRYPESGDKYAEVLMQQGGMMDKLKSLATRLGMMLEGLLQDVQQMNPQAAANIPQQQLADMTQAIQESKMVSGQQGK